MPLYQLSDKTSIDTGLIKNYLQQLQNIKSSPTYGGDETSAVQDAAKGLNQPQLLGLSRFFGEDPALRNNMYSSSLYNYEQSRFNPPPPPPPDPSKIAPGQPGSELSNQLQKLPAPVGDYSYLLKPNALLSGAPGEQAFQDYIKQISAPTSTEQVQQQLESERLKQTLEQIDLDTKQQLANTKSSFQERGLGGPGQLGDIEANALAQVESGAGRTKAGARVSMEEADLARLAQKEKMVGEAYGRRYDVSAQAGEKGIEMAQQAELAYADISSKENINRFNQILDAMLKQESLSQSDKQFFADLAQKMQIVNQQAGLDRELTLAKINAQEELNKPKITDYISAGGKALEGLGTFIGAVKK